MTEATLVNPLETLVEHFLSGWVKKDDRPGYSGFIVEREHLLDFARAMRDDFGFDYLSMVTASDYLAEGIFDVCLLRLTKRLAALHWFSKCKFRARCGSAIPGGAVPGRGFSGARIVGSDGHPLRRAPGSAQNFDVGRL